MSLITVAKPALYEFTEKKSKFIGLCFPVQNEEEAIAYINEIRKEHMSATHVVYAFSIGDNIQRSTDDGEPSGTAGRPVLEVIKNSGLNNIIVLVVRYFGGILLGTGG
ncbi:MAG: YigZ family protein, partial [Firmicutes bacterium]|nr:YigZ family protein [Bacillota bacterium]